ncbi:MAG TPA: (2Fe-2S)-binding protein, partial [Desulfobacterales bacterium]|nr:(2Fe-2S)-binding protein [Desulfobacterales bacterium]
MGEVSLLINGLYVKVPAGTTILMAARQLDIEIPTLCY